MVMNKRWTSSVLIIALCSGVLVIWLNRYALFDWYVLQNFKPSIEIAQLATNSGMSQTGANIFYSHAPKIAGKEEFNSACTEDEKTIVLGCYTGFDFNRDTDIFVYDVEKPELAGIKEVTAAHEMLHAAYDRLSQSEKKRINELTANALLKLNNPRIANMVESYRQRDAASVPNEIHSILGTEVATLDAELESYFSRYFTNRQAVVTLSSKYESVFDTNQNEIDKLSGTLALRKNEISKLETVLEGQRNQLENQKNTMDTYVSSNDITAYNAMVPIYNRLVDQFNSAVADYKKLIDEYNALIAEYNSKAVYQEELVNSIDSKYQPIN